jgi:hypothetical protein
MVRKHTGNPVQTGGVEPDGCGMDRLRVRISRCSLALSLAVKLGLAAWLAFAVLGGPTGSVALTPPSKQILGTASAVDEVQSRRSKRRARSPEPRKEVEAEARKASETGKGSDDKSAAPTKPPEGDAAAKAAPDHQPAETQPETKELAWTDAEIIAALEECVQVLAPIAAHVEVSKPIRSGQCGSPAAVVVKRVGAAMPVEISPPAVVNCRMAARLHEWVETILQPAAEDLLKARVTRMINASGYTCRNRNGSSQDKISEHAFANALDISAFVTADRRTIDVLTHWGKTERDLRAIALARAEAERKAREEAAAAKAAEAAAKAAEKDKSKAPARSDKAEAPARAGKDKDGKRSPELDPDERAEPPPKEKRRGREVAVVERSNLGGGNPRPVAEARASDDRPAITTEGTFLRRLHKGACGPFSTVLGPEANEAHRNHFHFDLAERRSRRAFCE